MKILFIKNKITIINTEKAKLKFFFYILMVPKLNFTHGLNRMSIRKCSCDYKWPLSVTEPFKDV